MSYVWGFGKDLTSLRSSGAAAVLVSSCQRKLHLIVMLHCCAKMTTIVLFFLELNVKLLHRKQLKNVDLCQSHQDSGTDLTREETSTQLNKMFFTVPSLFLRVTKSEGRFLRSLPPGTSRICQVGPWPEEIGHISVLQAQRELMILYTG